MTLIKELQKIKRTTPSKLFGELEHNLLLWQKEYERGCGLKNKANTPRKHRVADRVKAESLQGIIEEIDKFKGKFLKEVVS